MTLPTTTRADTDAPTDSQPKSTSRASALASRFGLIAIWALVCLFFSLLPATSDVFPTMDNIATIFGSQAVIAILTLALVVPLVTGDYDLSVAFNMTLSAMIIAVLNVQHQWPILGAVLVALLAGAVVGLVNAMTILFFRI